MAARQPWAAYAAGSDVADFASFCETFLRHSVDEWAGRPFKLEPWQKRLMGEVMAFDEAGESVWRSAVIVLPRKNGKTQLLAAYAVYRLVTSGGSPEILLAASSDRQAGRLFDACAAFVRDSEHLRRLCRVRDHAGEIVREDGGGKMYRLSSDPARLHGYNPSLVVVDELHAWTTPSLKRAYAALTTAGGARKAPQVITITTAGEAHERESSILGRLLDQSEARGEVESKPGVSVNRMFDARTLVVNWSAPTDDPSDIAAMKRANPASWITKQFLRRQAENPELTKAEVLQLHGCVWAAGMDAWIDPARWQALGGADRIPAGSTVWVAVDAALTRDTTAVVWAARNEDGTVTVESRIWAAMREAVAHEYVEGGRISLELVERFVSDELARRFDIAELVYDPRFFERSAELLAQSGLVVASLDQSSGAMADANQGWYDAVIDGTVRHTSDPVLTSHVLSTAAERTERGWKIRKLRHNRRIDGHVAAVMARYRAGTEAPAPFVMVV